MFSLLLLWRQHSSQAMATQSPVFEHFHEPVGTANGISKPKCKRCDNEVSMKGKSTSNLITHLKVCVLL